MYVDPNTVVSPKASWVLKNVIYNSGPGKGGWSVAEGLWEGDSCLGVRWNGSSAEEGVGNPQSRGHATWFIIPEGLEDAIRREVDFLIQTEEKISCVINQPDEYEFGAWRVVVTLGPQVLKQIGSGLLIFTLPTLQNRSCHPDRGYGRAIEGELRGSFVDGKWLGDVYSNGISEDENPTKIEAVRDAFTQNVMRAIQSTVLLSVKNSGSK